MMTAKCSITLDIDLAALTGYSDTQLMTLWHVAQANPADGFADQEPRRLAELIGRETIRRWLMTTKPELWRHQGLHYYWKELTKHGQWIDGDYTPNPATQEPEASHSEDEQP